MRPVRSLDPTISTRAKALRRAPTAAERCLWDALRGSQLGWKFRRQHPIGGFVVDFFCVRTRLAIEVDGDAHTDAGRRAYDRERTMALTRFGVAVLRFTNTEVFESLEGVVRTIIDACQRRASRDPREHR